MQLAKALSLHIQLEGRLWQKKETNCHHFAAQMLCIQPETVRTLADNKRIW
jgi:hypothetical protein